MNFLSIIFTLNFLALGLVFCFVASIARRAAHSTNRRLGMRTRAILASPEAWKRAHLYAAPHLRRLAVLCFVFSGIQLIFENPWVASLLNLDEDALMIIGVAPTAIVIGLLLLLAHKADEVAKSTPPR